MTFPEIINALDHWLAKQNFPRHENLRVRISVNSLNGVARLSDQIIRDLEPMMSTAMMRPHIGQGQFKFGIQGIEFVITAQVE